MDMKGMDICQSDGKKIKFYCHDHSKLCCTTCGILHAKCQLDEISRVSGRKVPDPSFLKQILLQSEADADSLIANCKQSKTGLNQSIANISKELQEMRDRVMKLFDMAEKRIMNEANAVKSVEVKRLDDINAASSKINQVLSVCSALLENGTPDQKYIFWRNFQQRNETFISDITEQRNEQVTTKMTLSFPKELTTILEKGNNDIKLNCERKQTVETSLISLSSQPRPITLKLLVSVDLQKTGDDKEKPLLSGLDFLPDGRLVAVDNRNKNKKCIILNERLERLGTPYKFKDYPYSVVCVSHDTLCVTGGGAGKVVCLLSVSTDNTITLTREINTTSLFDSICCMSPSNMVVSTYNDPRPVRMISVDGVESDFDYFLTFPMKTYKLDESACTYVQTKNTLVLTDQLAHTVYMNDTVNGTSRAVTNENIQEPRGACVGPGYTVLVCSSANDSIVHLTIHGKMLGTYPVDMKSPNSICVSKDGTRIAVSNNYRGARKLQLYKISPAMS
ncbi:uncharacterized protein LOC127838835 [Dreissena polymorpha]|uniref:B box-type domain-containing protein n=1 Tax=Dreissena polymorpha TaxID=45954 RepID=A0A9D4J3Z1_DREPO|nr:uncharacterized protein LOC127838835 [Dreissena polymorpha]KAH3797540.1 hypothetical protein DPMN_151122 [Dreissena polymorpha]